MSQPASAVSFDLPAISSVFTSSLPADSVEENRCRQVSGACFSHVLPTQVAAPRTVAWAREVAESLDLPESFCNSQAFAEVMAGNRLLDGMTPYAMCYGGHQFGNWAGQLGDGRAINLGEIVNRAGEHWVLQLKGAGPTPYSRGADGRAVLRSSVREFLCSEAMHHLGVPTTRALSLVLTGDEVVRDMFYDGHSKPEPGAVVCRVSPSFVRFGSFEIFASRGEVELLRKLLDFTIAQDFPHLGAPGKDTYLAWYREVCERTALLMSEWMRVGFVHGVMNTDNMSALGLTIDYGPYGWVDDFDPNWTPNTTDAHGRRYRFGQQPNVALWNLAQLGNALYPLIEDVAPLQETVESYRSTFDTHYCDMMSAKLGLAEYLGDEDGALRDDLLQLLSAEETDMTLFYRALAGLPMHGLGEGVDAGLTRADVAAALEPVHYQSLSSARLDAWWTWMTRYAARVARDGASPEERVARMNAVNPKYVLRNYLAQLAIDKAEAGDYAPVHELLEVLRRPYDEQPEHGEYAALRPDWARTRAGCSMLSCSS